MTRKLLLSTSVLGAMFGTFALTGPAHAEIFMCGQFQCEENPTTADGASIYESGTVCWVGSGQTGQADVTGLRACVEAVTGKTSVSMHVRAQGASGRSETTWNGGLAVTQFAFGAQPLFPESGGYLHYKVGQQPAAVQDGGAWLLAKPENASFVATTAAPTLDSVLVLAGGGGSKGRVLSSIDKQVDWTTTAAAGGRGGWALGWNFTPEPYDNENFVSAAGTQGGSDGSAGGGGPAFNMSGGFAGSSGGRGLNIPSEGGYGKLYGPTAYGAQSSPKESNLMSVGGEGGQGDGGGGGGGVYADCPFMGCDREEMLAAAGGGGGSRALRTSMKQTLPVFEEEPRVELVFNYYDITQEASVAGGDIVIGGDTLEVTRNTGVATQLQNLTQFGWQNDTQLFWPTTAIGDELDVSFDAPSAGVYNLVLNFTQAPDYGNYKLFLNGVELADVNGYAPGVAGTAIDFGDHSFNAGANTLTLKIIGNNYRSQNYFAGIDFIGLTEFVFGPLSNLALSGTASQSSTAADGGVARRAIDNDTSGEWERDDVTLTKPGSQSYWDLDLGSVHNIQTINVFNRTDCCSSRLNNFYVFVSDVPFTGTTVAASQLQADVQDNYYAGAAGAMESFEINRTGRYVRVQLSNTTISEENVLSLAEVQVLGN